MFPLRILTPGEVQGLSNENGTRQSFTLFEIWMINGKIVTRFDDELGRGVAGGWPSEALHLLQQEEEVKKHNFVSQF